MFVKEMYETAIRTTIFLFVDGIIPIPDALVNELYRQHKHQEQHQNLRTLNFKKYQGLKDCGGLQFFLYFQLVIMYLLSKMGILP